MHAGLADKTFAKKLLNDAVKLYESKGWSSKLKAEKYEQAKKLLKKL